MAGLDQGLFWLLIASTIPSGAIVCGTTLHRAVGWKDFRVLNDAMFNGTTFAILPVDNSQQCLRLCWLYKACTLLTYVAASGMCRLTSFDVPDMTSHIADDVTDAVTVDMRLALPDEPKPRGCDKRPCDVNEVCVPVIKTSAYECLKTGHTFCPGPIPVVANAVGLNDGVNNVVYQCDKGHLTKGTSHMSTCDRSSGQWSPVDTQCVHVDCGPPPGVIKAKPNDGHGTHFNAMVTYTCLEGHVSNPTAMTVTCQEDNQWSTTPTGCTYVTCPVPVELPDADVRVLDRSPLDAQSLVHIASDFPRSFGGKALHSCKPGFTSSNGNVTSACQADGTWSVDVTFACSRVECGLPPNVANAWSLYNATTFEATVDFMCKDGFLNSTVDMRLECGETRSWDGQEVTCQPMDCGIPPEEDLATASYNGTVFGERAIYTCDYPTIPLVEGSNPIRWCQADGNWTNQTVNCVRCGSPPPLDSNLTVTISHYPGVDMYLAEYSCPEGSRSIFGVIVAFCHATKTKWDSDLQLTIRCEPIVCRDPDALNYALPVYASKAYGSSLSYNCNQGFKLSSNSSRQNNNNNKNDNAIDNDNNNNNTNNTNNINNDHVNDNDSTFSSFTCSSNLQWINEEGDAAPGDLTCEPIFCGQPPSVEGANLTLATQALGYNSTAIYHCLVGTMLMTDSNSKRCTENGWEDTTAPIRCGPCDSVDCGGLPPPDVNNTTPDVNNTTPDVNNTTPDVNNTTPDVNNTTPDNTTPDVNNTTPDVNNTTPDNTTPDVNNTTPDVNNTTPDVNNTTPDVNNTTPDVNNTTPDVNNTTPDVNNTTPDVNNTTPDVNNTTPDVNNTTPDVNNTTPDNTTPDVNNTMPDNTTPDNTTPDVNNTTPDNTTPDVNNTMPDNTTPDNTTPDVNNTTPDNTTPDNTTPDVNNTTPDNTTPDVNNTTPDNTTPDVNNTTPDVNNTTPDLNNTTQDVNKTTLDLNNTTPDVNKITLDLNNTTPDVNNTTISPMTCGPPPEVDNTQILSIDTSGVPIQVSYQCEEGHEPKNPGGGMVKKCLDVDWSQEEVGCDPVDCGHPPDVDNASMTSSVNVYQGVASYVCLDGLFPLHRDGGSFNDSLTRNCQANGTWSLEQFSCSHVDTNTSEASNASETSNVSVSSNTSVSTTPSVVSNTSVASNTSESPITKELNKTDDSSTCLKKGQGSCRKPPEIANGVVTRPTNSTNIVTEQPTGATNDDNGLSDSSDINIPQAGNINIPQAGNIGIPQLGNIAIPQAGSIALSNSTDTALSDPGNIDLSDPDNTALPDPDNIALPDPDNTALPDPDTTALPDPDNTALPDPQQADDDDVDCGLPNDDAEVDWRVDCDKDFIHLGPPVQCMWNETTGLDQWSGMDNVSDVCFRNVYRNLTNPIDIDTRLDRRAHFKRMEICANGTYVKVGDSNYGSFHLGDGIDHFPIKLILRHISRTWEIRRQLVNDKEFLTKRKKLDVDWSAPMRVCMEVDFQEKVYKVFMNGALLFLWEERKTFRERFNHYFMTRRNVKVTELRIQYFSS